MPVEYRRRENLGEFWWCNIHQRKAEFVRTMMNDDTFKVVCCDPSFGGIMLPCSCVNLTDLIEFIPPTEEAA